jgi:hypothetical protein
MSVIKISDLTNIETPVLTDVLPIVNEDETKKITLEQIVNVAKANITILSVKIVDNIDKVTEENILYLVPISNDNGNMYNEYMLVNGKVEQVGSQTVDLTGYAKTTEVQQMINTAIGGALEGSY